MMSTDLDYIEEVKARIIDRYTASELVELLELETDDIIEVWWEYLLQFHPNILEEVGVDTQDEGSEPVLPRGEELGFQD
jgi:hypothetical protein